MNLHVTPRETKIMELLSFGFSTKEIADMLGISYNTAETHIKNIKQKTGLQKVSELVCAYLYKRYHLPLMDISERTRARIAAALLALSLFAVFFETTDFLRVLRSQTRTNISVRTGARRSGRRSENFYMEAA